MKHIILVEDDPAIADSLGIFFQRSGIRLTAFRDGTRVMQGAFENPDLFLLDKQLSGVDGIDICRFLKSQQRTKHIPVIMISASPSVMALSEEAGADGVIIKPYKLADLRSVAEKYL